MSHRSVGIRHFAWNPEPEFIAKYRGIPAFPVISTGNLQRSNRVVDRSLNAAARAGSRAFISACAAHMFTSASLIVRFSSIHRSTALDAALSRLVGG